MTKGSAVKADTERDFREYVVTRQAHLLRTAALLTGDRSRAEDLLQTVLTEAATRWDRIRRTDNPDAYVRRMLYNEQISWWRRAVVNRERSTDRVPEVPVVPDDADLRLTLAAALRQLTPSQRAMVVLRYYEDLPEAQVAEILGCSVGTVRSQTHRAITRLRKLDPSLETIT
jgi:RNA polymerase sigma-70 factor (sigma-E family)